MIKGMITLSPQSPTYDQTQRESYRHGYQGQYSEMDTVTGWNAFELRMYDPLIGRWLQVDPMREFSSPYRTGNNPMNKVDPTGGCEEPPCNPVTVISHFDRTVVNEGAGWVWEYGEDQSEFFIDSEGMYGGYLWNYDDYFSQNDTRGMVDQPGGIMFLTTGALSGGGLGATSNFADAVTDLTTGGLPGDKLTSFVDRVSRLINASNLLGDAFGQSDENENLKLLTALNPRFDRGEFIGADTIKPDGHTGYNFEYGGFYRVDTVKENYSNGSQVVYWQTLLHGVDYHKN